MSGGGLPALEFWGIALGLREGVILLILLVTLYMVFVLLRMRRLQPPRSSPPEMVAPTLSANTQGKPAEPGLPKQGSSSDEAEEDMPLYERVPAKLVNDTLHLGMAQEIAQLREELDSVRGELAALRQDMQQEVAHLHSAQSVSPIYGDAMQMALAGYDSVMIADRCGIARGEADLVVALAKSQGQ